MNSRLSLAFAVTALCWITTLPTQGQVVRRITTWGPQAGDAELILSGGGSSDTEFNSGNGVIQVSLGTYLDDNWELSLRQALGFEDDDQGFDVSGITRVGLDYHLNLRQFRPFVGITVGGSYADNASPAFLAGAEAGLKYYLQRKTFLFIMADYTWNFDSWEEITSNVDDGAIAYSIGIGLNF